MREVYGLDEALRRGEAYLRAGADGLFIEAPTDRDALRTIGRTFDVPLLANVFEGRRTPLLPPKEPAGLGFRIVVCGISPLMWATQGMRDALAAIARGEVPAAGGRAAFDGYKQLVNLPYWSGVEEH